MFLRRSSINTPKLKITPPKKFPASSGVATPDASVADSSSLEFSSVEEHHRHLEAQGKLPLGFQVGTEGFRFVPEEVPKEVTMNVTAIVLDEVGGSF